MAEVGRGVFLDFAESECLTEQKKQQNKMLHLAGMDVQDAFETLPPPTVPVNQVPLGEFDASLKILNVDIEYKPNTAFERCQF